MDSFSDFMMQRCEEIIEKDKDYTEVSSRVRELSKKFFSSLSPEQQKDYLKFESEIEGKISIGNISIYKQAYLDGKNGF